MSNCATVMSVLAREASVVLTEQPTTSHPDSPTPDKVEATIYTPQVPLLSTTTLSLFSTFVTGTIFNFIIHFTVLYEFGMEMGSLLLQFGEYFVKSIFQRCHVSQLHKLKRK